MSNLAVRIATAAILLPGIIFLLFLENSAFFCLLAGIVSLLATHEVFAMLRRLGYRPFSSLGYGVVALIQFAAYAAFKEWPHAYSWNVHLSVAVVTALVAGILLAQFARGHNTVNLGNACVTVLGVLYAGWLSSFIIRLRGVPNGAQWVFVALSLTWIFDSAAYFWGSSVGRTKLWVEVSPGKTWEGFIGGILTTVVVVWAAFVLLPEAFLFRVAPYRASTGFMLALAVALSVIAQAGDLVESMIKRTVGIKDSSALIPGHGGILDKIDSMLFTVPLVYYAALIAQGMLV